MKPGKTKYEQFQEWLDRCPVEITNYKDYSTEFEINFEAVSYTHLTLPTKEEV